ncbi:LysR family transcriptional regulator [Serratia sp. D1N4]
MDQLSAMRVLVRVIESGSFTAVAREMGASQPTISKQIRGLEKRLGTTLLARSTRHVAPTTQGLLYYQECRAILQALDDVELRIGAAEGQLSGVLRVGVPSAFGRMEVIPYLAAFLEMYPGLKIEILLSDDIADLLQSGIDVAFRCGHSLPEGAVARKLGEIPSNLFASKEYLARYGIPQTPEQLTAHHCITYQNATLLQRYWQLKLHGEVFTIPVNGQLSCNSSDGLRAAVLSNLGISYAQPWLFKTEIAEGQVVTLLPDYHLSPRPLYAIYLPERRGNLRIGALMAYLEQCWRRNGTLPLCD